MSVHNGSRPSRRAAARRKALYDLDGTLMDLNLVHAAAYILANVGEWRGRLKHLANLAARLPLLYLAERYDRHLLNVEMFALFQDISRDRLIIVGEEYCERVLANHLYPQALALLEGNRAAGLEPVLVSGSPDFIVAPLARLLGIEIFAANCLTYSRGLATGRISGPVMAGEEKAHWCAQLAGQSGIALADCWGYADSYYDLPFLVALGHPVAVNPDRRLAATARVRHWPTVHFDKPSAAAFAPALEEA